MGGQEVSPAVSHSGNPQWRPDERVTDARAWREGLGVYPDGWSGAKGQERGPSRNAPVSPFTQGTPDTQT